MLLELASGGDLFDKIGENCVGLLSEPIVVTDTLTTAPEVGLEEEIAQYYFNQLTSGLVRVSNVFIQRRSAEAITGLHPRARRLSSGSQAGKPTFRRRWPVEDQ